MYWLGIVAILYVIFREIKIALTPTLSEEHLANKELQHKDMMSGMSAADIAKNATKGRYYLPKESKPVVKYPIPHRNSQYGGISIENCELYDNDIKQYGAYEAHIWAKQGKYNLTENELKIARLGYEKKRIEFLYPPGSYGYEENKARLEEISRIISTANMDFRKAEAAVQWQQANDAESR